MNLLLQWLDDVEEWDKLYVLVLIAVYFAWCWAYLTLNLSNAIFLKLLKIQAKKIHNLNYLNFVYVKLYVN